MFGKLLQPEVILKIKMHKKCWDTRLCSGPVEFTELLYQILAGFNQAGSQKERTGKGEQQTNNGEIFQMNSQDH